MSFHKIRIFAANELSKLNLHTEVVCVRYCKNLLFFEYIFLTVHNCTEMLISLVNDCNIYTGFIMLLLL